MAHFKIDGNVFSKVYMTVLQIIVKLVDTTFLWIEAGRGTGKTTQILASRMDRVMNDMPGAVLYIVEPTYKAIFDIILPEILSYFRTYYVEDVYYCVGKRPPEHFAPCDVSILNWKHTIILHNGCVLRFASTDRPESLVGINTPHLFIDEALRIREGDVELIFRALRADKSKYGHSHYFQGITLTTSTPNFRTDNDWFINNEKLMNKGLVHRIVNLAKLVDEAKYYLIRFKSERKETIDVDRLAVLDAKIQQRERFISRWSERLKIARRNQHFYVRASSFSNIKILGINYIKTQYDITKDKSKFNTSILSIRSRKPKELFAGKFGKEHLYQDSYRYDYIDSISAGNYDQAEADKARHLKHYNKNLPIYAGFDPGPFMSIVFAQRFERSGGSRTRKFRVIKDMHVIHPNQQVELAGMINDFFEGHRRKEIFLHYDRAANQHDPNYRKYYPNSGLTDLNDTDAQLLKKELEKHGWRVVLMSLGQGVIYYSQLYALLNILFGKNDGRRDDIMIDENVCTCLVSSLQSSPLKRHEGRIMLDKSSERELDYEDQAMWSTQIFTALLYLLWGEYKKILPRTGMEDVPESAGTYMA